MKRLKKRVRVLFHKACKDSHMEQGNRLFMPTEIEAALREEAQKKYPIDHTQPVEEQEKQKQKQDAFIYGTMRHRYGWKPEREKV